MLRELAISQLVLLLAPLAAASGDVTVTVTPEGGLLVVGDGQGNNIIFVHENGFLELTHNGGTINGGSSSYVVEPVRGGLIVDLGKGDDSLGIEQTFVADDIEVDFGSGDDFCDIESAGGSLLLDLGDGDDHLNLEAASFDRTRVLGGAGDDDISLFYFAADVLALRAGAGNDEVSIRFCLIGGPTRVDGGDGADLLDLEDPGFAGPTKIVGFETRLL